MNKIKKIYYPVLAVLTLALFVLGLVSAVVNFSPKASNTVYTRMTESLNLEHNSYNSTNQERVRNALVNNIFKNSATAIKDCGGAYKSNGYEGASFGSESNLSPRYLTQNATLDQSAVEDLSTDDTLVYVDKDVYNIIVAIPGKTQEEAVLFSANYDSAPGSQSATECMQAVALLETAVKYANDYASGKVPEKTLLFVITDAEHEGGYGLRAFRYQFNGFNGIADKVTLAVNFGASGTGPLSVYSDKISVSKVSGLASGIVEAVSGDEFYDYDVYDCAKINVFFGGDRGYINTPRDTVENLSKSKVDAVYGTMNKLVDAYGYGKFDTSDVGGSFSYLGATFSYSNIISYVLGGVALVLLILAVLMMVRAKKAGEILKGVGVQLLSLIATAIVLYACYFLLALILSGFGIIPIHAITSVEYMNMGLFISSLLLALVAYVAIFLLMRRVYKLKATDAARGAALLIMLVGIVTAFAFPSGSFIFALSAVLEGIMLIITSGLGKKFKEKNGADIERLFLYFVPVILLTPAMLPVMIVTGYSLALVYFPLILTAAALGMATIAPYFATLRPVLEKAVSKLPKHTVRVERTVTERVEGPKKGRYTEVTHKKVTNEKVEWTYRNRYALSIVGVLSVILVILFAVCPTKHFSTNAIGEFPYREAIKDDSVVFVWDLAGDSAATAKSKLTIFDQMAYKYFDNIDDEYVWNKDSAAYEKEFIGDVTGVFGTAAPVTINTSGSIMTITPFGNANESFIDVKLTGVDDVTEFTVQANGKRLEIENPDGKSELQLVLPYGDDDYKSFTIEFTIDEEYSSSTLSIGCEFTQYVSGNQASRTLNNINDFESLKSEFMRLYPDDMRCGILLHKTSTYSISK